MDTFFREQMKKGHDLFKAIEEIESGKFVQAKVPSVILDYLKNPSRYVVSDPHLRTAIQKYWSETKIERNAIAAIIIRKTWEKIKEERVRILENKISENFDPLFAFNYYNMASSSALNLGVNKVVREMGEDSPVIVRFKELIKLSDSGVIRGLPRGTSVEHFITRGVHTANFVAWRLAILVHDFLKHESSKISEEKFMKILHHAFKTIAVQLASMHLRITPKFLDLISTKHYQNKHGLVEFFNAEYFSFDNSSKSPKIEINWQIIKHDPSFRKMFAEFQNQNPENCSLSDKTKCPAFFAEADEGDVLRQHLMWVEQIIQKHFKEIFNEDFPLFSK